MSSKKGQTHDQNVLVVPDGQTLKVVLVQESVVVDVVHVADHKLDPVVPRVSHFGELKEERLKMSD